MVDTSGADRMLLELDAYVAEGWKDVAAEEGQAVILELTAQGLDADGKKFSGYTDDHAAVRAGLGLQTGFKDLNMRGLSRRSGNLLGSLKPRRDGTKVTLGVSLDANSRANKVAHGQMFHPKWAAEKHSKFLAVGERMMRRCELAIAHPLAKGIENGLSKLKKIR
jgi:hypothetical protein